jgi:predicted HTH domain antitoxin
MQVTLTLPDGIAQQLALGQDLSRTALEALVIEGCRAHRLSDGQAAELLGMNQYELDGFLKRHGVFLDYSIEDYERDREVSQRLWRKRQAELSDGRESQSR